MRKTSMQVSEKTNILMGVRSCKMKTIKNMLDRIVELFCIGIMGIMTILVTWQVFTRYVLNNPSTITEQSAQYLFVWLVLYGAAYVFGKRDHMAITFIKDKMPFKIKAAMEIVQEIVIALFALGVMVYGGYISSLKQMAQLDAALQIPIGIIYSAIPISGGFIIFYTIYNIKSIVEKLKHSDEQVKNY